MNYRQFIYILTLPWMFVSCALQGEELKVESLKPIISSLVDIAEYHRQDSSKAVPIILETAVKMGHLR